MAQKIVTSERISLSVLQEMRREFDADGDSVGHYVMDYLVMKYLECEDDRPAYVERLRDACIRDCDARTDREVA